MSSLNIKYLIANQMGVRVVVFFFGGGGGNATLPPHPFIQLLYVYVFSLFDYFLHVKNNLIIMPLKVVD